MGGILVYLCVIFGMTVSLGAGHAGSHAEATGAAGHGHHHPAPDQMDHAVPASGGPVHLVPDQSCSASAGHCIGDLVTLFRVGVQLRLPRDSGHLLHPQGVSPHRMPEIETPPPRV